MLLYGCGPGRGQEDKCDPSPTLPPEGEGIRGWAPLERAEMGKSSLVFKCFSKVLEGVFPASL